MRLHWAWTVILALTCAAGCGRSWPTGALGHAPTPVPLAGGDTATALAAPAPLAAAPAVQVQRSPLAGIDIHAVDLHAGRGAAVATRGCYGGSGCTGILLWTADARRGWHVADTTAWPLRSLHFAGARGWAVGGNCPPAVPTQPCTGALLQTSDGGRTWHVLYRSTGSGIRRAIPTGRQGGWLETAAGDLWHTSDGGRDWQPAKIPCAHGGAGPLAFSGTSGWLVCGSGTLYRTDDGGSHWRAAGAAALPAGVAGIAAASGALWARTLASAPSLWLSLNAGRNWRPAAGTLGGADITALHANSGRRAYAVVGLGPRGAVVHTTDGGRTWTPVYPRSGAPLATTGMRSLSFFGAQRGLALGMAAGPRTLWQTADAGRSWQAAGALPAEAVVVDWAFRTPSLGWAVLSIRGGTPRLYGTNDGGRNWTPVSAAAGLVPSAVTPAGPTGLRLEAAGRLYRLDAGGHPVPLGRTPDLTNLDFTGSRHGWAIARGEVQQTRDGGSRWTAVPLPPGWAAVDLSFPRPQDGWVLAQQACANDNGCPFALAHTTDGGLTWSWGAMGRLQPTDVVFSGPATGWLVTTYGGLYRTTDGGRSWSRLS